MGTKGDDEYAQNLVNNCLRGTRHFLSLNWPNLVLASWVNQLVERVGNNRSIRATLHYGGEVHWSVKNFSPRPGYLRQRMVCRRR